MLGLYADDAERRTVNRNTIPSSPRVLLGREGFRECLRDMFRREMILRVANGVVGQERLAFNEAREYPDGIRVLAARTLGLRDGKVCASLTSKSGTSSSDAGVLSSRAPFRIATGKIRSLVDTPGCGRA